MLIIISLLIACTPEVENPLGTCEAETNGSRACYHFPSPDDTYLLDCNAPLDRELWRVFAQTDESAYIIPRPDALGLQFGLCDGESDDAILLQQYGLCDQILDSEGVTTINEISPVDALSITSILHQNLRFEVGEGNVVSPWVPDEDMIDACDLISDSSVDEYCANIELSSSGNDCPEIFYSFPEDTAILFADALNQLYGIE